MSQLTRSPVRDSGECRSRSGVVEDEVQGVATTGAHVDTAGERPHRALS
ncbi:MAG: hypothetical protein JWN03_2620 [Nocardia sp.]|nr:hypothetical protein [Nocardia sp.]